MAALAFNLNYKAISPWREMGAYEALWDTKAPTFEKIAKRFSAHPGSLPSDFVPDENLCESYATRTVQLLEASGINRFGIRLHGAGEYPKRLRDAYNPVEMLYFQGSWSLTESRCISIVGTRKPSAKGAITARKIATRLAQDGFTIVSGLAEGIDTLAHGAAIAQGKPTIGVIGTPLSHSYPNKNAHLQRFIAKEHLLISQVPVCSYETMSFKMKPAFFPERNITMAALTEATVIIEASDTSGTLSQARAALDQKRKLFILDSCFGVPGHRWPTMYEKRGAIRVRTYRDIIDNLGAVSPYSRETEADRSLSAAASFPSLL
jgi:DNA processing protein